MIAFRQWLNFLLKHNLISQHKCGMLSQVMLFFFHEAYMSSNPIDVNFFQASTSIAFEVIYENPSQVPEYLHPHVSYISSNTKSSSTQLKVLLNWPKVIIFSFPYIMSSIKYISKFLSARRKHLEQKNSMFSHMVRII